MATTLDISNDRRRCTIRLAGTVTLDDIAACIDRQIACGAWTLETIVDTTDATHIQLLFASVQQLIRMLKQRGDGLPPRGPFVVIAPNDMFYGTARMFQIAAESHVSGGIHVVRSLQDAETWLADIATE